MGEQGAHRHEEERAARLFEAGFFCSEPRLGRAAGRGAQRVGREELEAPLGLQEPQATPETR